MTGWKTTRRGALGIALVLAALMPAEVADSAAPATRPGSFAGVYDMFFAGLLGGEMEMTASLEGEAYSAQARGRTAGIVAALWEAGFDAQSTGSLRDGAFEPTAFDADSFSPKKRQKLAMRYEAGRPSEVSADPPFDPKPWELEPSEQAGTFDPISAALSGLALQGDGHVCNRSVEIFDGRRRYAIDLQEAETLEDGTRRCQAVYRRVAGFKPKQLAKPDWPFRVWFQQRPDGLWSVSKALGETPIGVVVVRLRQD
ncbi:MAG: DUF3108 domain-containing protein [Pseudomonadota bacterium]